MYLKPTQGNPLYYQYGALRSWAASKLGLGYSFEDQCVSFFAETAPILNEGTGSTEARMQFFQKLFQEERQRMLEGSAPRIINPDNVQSLDVYYSRQPKPRGKKRSIVPTSPVSSRGSVQVL